MDQLWSKPYDVITCELKGSPSREVTVGHREWDHIGTQFRLVTRHFHPCSWAFLNLCMGNCGIPCWHESLNEEGHTSEDSGLETIEYQNIFGPERAKRKQKNRKVSLIFSLFLFHSQNAHSKITFKDNADQTHTLTHTDTHAHTYTHRHRPTHTDTRIHIRTCTCSHTHTV